MPSRQKISLNPQPNNVTHRFLCFRLVVVFVLVGSYFLLPKYGFTFISPVCSDSVGTPISHFSSLISHLTYPLSHANIFHLAANCLCLFLLRCPLHLAITYTIAVLSSFLPSFALSSFHIPLSSLHSEPTMGFSGVIFAMVGMSWGRVHRFREMLSRNKWFLIIPAFIPNINALLHLYCLLLGYLVSSTISKYRNIEIPPKNLNL